jgi:hypothetical protein
MALNVSSQTAFSARCSQRHERQHRRHERLDHAGALGDPADAERARIGMGLDRRLFRKGIGRHDGARGRRAAVW